MRNRTHDNSLEAYEALHGALGQRQAFVYHVITCHGPVTRQQIAEHLEVPINQVTGRVRELIDKNLIHEGDNDYTTGRPRATLVVGPSPFDEDGQGRLL